MKKATSLRGGRGSALGIREPDDRFSGFMRRNLVGAGGLFIIAIAAAYAAALATWSVSDPSLSHATDQPVRNALGMPGAILADPDDPDDRPCGFRFSSAAHSLGLAASQRTAPPLRPGAISAPGSSGTFLAAGAVSALPTPETWPLPTDLGGVIGSALIIVPDTMTQSLSTGLQTIVGLFGFGLPAAVMLAYSVGLFGGMPVKPKTKRAAPKGHGARKEPVFDDFDEDEEERGGGLTMMAGAVAHWLLMIKAMFGRLFSPFARRTAEDELPEDRPEKVRKSSLRLVLAPAHGQR